MRVQLDYIQDIKTHYKDKRVISIFFLGFSSGLPFLLILSTLSAWLAESGISKTLIGLFAWVTIPYTLKLFWAPVIDHVKIPILCKKLGQRRGWLLFSQLLLLLSLICLGSTSPLENIKLTAFFALMVGFCSASQDIVVEAYRIETLPRRMLGYGASSSVFGYRFGLLWAGAGAMYIASVYSWSIAYNLMAISTLVGIVTTLLCTEPLINQDCENNDDNKQVKEDNKNPFLYSFKKPFKSFISNREWWVIIPFIFCYKFSDVVINAMSMPFLMEIGFSKIEIAHVAKSFGICAMIFGVIFGGLMVVRQSLKVAIMFCIFLQILSSGLFMVQAKLGHDLSFLFVSIGIENFASGIGQVTLVAYLSRLCSMPHTATHYALLSSFASLVRVLLSMGSGWVADRLLWTDFYTLVSIGCLPSLLVVIIFSSHFFEETEVGKLDVNKV